MSSSKLTFIFFRGVGQPPTSKCMWVKDGKGTVETGAWINFLPAATPQKPPCLRKVQM